ncbi:MAG: hypothetical protein K2X93_03535 [Candidatus Obscuribacterales bacterium]|nr:hypothetical protein [Candidatus Obscuribacterales bacterium]
MSNSLERRDDGSLSLFIDGRLRFDSRDEHIFHESLVLPALVLSCIRSEHPLDVLILGGGDGLAAREVFKVDRISTVDLVDSDPEVLTLGSSALKSINYQSFSDRRLDVHVEDAWEFVARAQAAGRRYDLIVSDLPVPSDIESARFHSVDWYAKLRCVLKDGGVLAANGVSCEATPWAFWSIFNSMAVAGLHTRPYHVVIPSFEALGYGADWGFFLSSNSPITAVQLDAVKLPDNCRLLSAKGKLFELFQLPIELFEIQSQAVPGLNGSSILLQYFQKGRVELVTGITYDVLQFSTTGLTIPPVDTGKDVLPEEYGQAMSVVFGEDGSTGRPVKTDPEQMLIEILEQIPSLQHGHAPELISDFLSEPAVFLQGIDLGGLVDRMLAHAPQLPTKFVRELETLDAKLDSWKPDSASLPHLGSNAVMFLTLVIIAGNLLYPDMVYAKGHGGWVRTNRAVERRYQKPNPGSRSFGEKQTQLQADQNSARDLEITREMLAADRAELAAYRQVLTEELQGFELSQLDEVEYGRHIVKREEALRLTEQALAHIDLQIASLASVLIELYEYDA